ncbi:MAG: hypothetical protein AAB338_02650 [Patescibacteria group bacterium]
MLNNPFIMPYKNREDLYKVQKRHRIKIRKSLLDFLSKKKCADCGENDPRVLDFDHIDPAVKFKTVSNMLSGHYSWQSVLAEISKCEVRCANFHRREIIYSSGTTAEVSPRSLTG